MEKIEKFKNSSIVADLTKYCHFAKEGHSIECYEWYNGEGVNIMINNISGIQCLSLTYGELEALSDIKCFLDEV